MTSVRPVVFALVAVATMPATTAHFQRGAWYCGAGWVAMAIVNEEQAAVTPAERPALGSGAGDESGPSCQTCGHTGSGAELLQWVMDRRAGKVSWTCPTCAATNIRALEAKLEPEWW